MFSDWPQVPVGMAPQEIGPGGTTNEYRADQFTRTFWGRLVLPVAGRLGEDEPPVVVDLHTPFTLREDRWTTERMGDAPTIPKTDTGGPHDTLLESAVGGVVPTDTPGNDNTKIWRMSGHNVHVLPKPVKPGDPVQLGANPISNATAQENTVPAQNQKPLLGAGKASNNPLGNNIARLRQAGGSRYE